MTDSSSDPDDIFAQLAATADAAGAAAMFDALAASLKARGRWHALFDLRLLQARISLGLPATGELRGEGAQGDISSADRDELDERSLAACREVGDNVLRVDDLDVVLLLDVGRRHNTLTALLQGEDGFLAVVQAKHHSLEVQQDVDDVLAHSVKRRILVHHADDLNLGGCVARHRGK